MTCTCGCRTGVILTVRVGTSVWRQRRCKCCLREFYTQETEDEPTFRLQDIRNQRRAQLSKEGE